jgi:zinc/manganese transport system permease protein
MFAGFMINTWIVASLVAIVAGLVGFFVVMRGASFAAHALPLGTFPGAALAALLGINIFAGLMLFSIAAVLTITLLAHRERQEVAIALTLVMLLSLGTLFLSMTSQYSQQVYALLFGEVLAISQAEMPPIAVISALLVGISLLLHKPLLLNSLSAELGAVQGVGVRRMEICFLAVLALATAMALPIVGALLVFSLMIGPPAIARFLTNRPMSAMAISVFIALFIVWLAIALSYLTNWPVGFFVGSVSAGCFALGRGGTWAGKCYFGEAAPKI